LVCQTALAEKINEINEQQAELDRLEVSHRRKLCPTQQAHPPPQQVLVDEQQRAADKSAQLQSVINQRNRDIETTMHIKEVEHVALSSAASLCLRRSK
jgi:hypothetical protein